MSAASYNVILERVTAEGNCPSHRADRVARTLSAYAEYAEVPADEVTRLLERMSIQQLTEYFYRQLVRSTG